MNVAGFRASLGFSAVDPSWSAHFSWSTIELTDWVVRRKKLKPIDLKFVLSANEKYWNATLTRHDETFFVAWRDSGISIESAQLRYRRLTAWPSIASPLEVPGHVKRLGEILGVSFLPHVHIGGTLADEALSGSFHDELLRQWIAPSATDWSVFGQKQPTARDGA